MSTRVLVVGDPLVVLGDVGVIRDGALVVEDGVVTRVGPRAELEGAEGGYARVIGSPGHAVLPGFVNAHYHSECNLVQGVYDTIFELANLWVHGLLGEIREDDLYDVLMVGLMDTVRGGQTCVVDAYYGRRCLPNFSADVALQAYWDLGTRVGFGLSFRDRNRYTHEGDEPFLARLPADVAAEVRASDMGYAWPVDEVEAAYRRLVADWDGRGGRVRVLAAPDWTPACSDELYLRCRALADEYDTGLTTHCLETRSEMAFNMSHHGTTAVRRLADLGVLGPDVSLAHFVWPTDEDIAIVADSGAVVASNPGSNLRLSSGICRTRDMLDAGVRVAVGTDGISATEREDYLAELRLSAYLQRVPRALESGRVDGPAYLRSAVESGAQAARMSDRVGSLEPGRDADLVLLRRDRVFWPPNRYDAADPIDVILDRADMSDIEMVMVQGRPVLDDGVITTVDEAAVRARHQEACERRLWERSPERQRTDVELPALATPHALDFYRTWSDLPVRPGYVYNAGSGVASDVD